MGDSPDVFLRWLDRGTALLAAATFLFGLFSALRPQRSIALYQWIMARFNWRVTPLDERRELRTTAWLGAVLIVLSLVVAGILCVRSRG